MMTSRKIDKIMKNVMLMYQAEAVKEFASYSDTPVEFSPEFENNIKMLSARNRDTGHPHRSGDRRCQDRYPSRPDRVSWNTDGKTHCIPAIQEADRRRGGAPCMV